jgi:16S rRNA U1498 N3-methylase RsmE
MKTLQLLILSVAFATSAFADGKVDFKQDDTTATVLKRQEGQRVELRLKSGEKISGKVAAIGLKSVHLSALTGQEMFDAVINLDDISAVLIRTATK